ncbi:carbohydrate ABC transporter permease [Paenibacillus nasutitermitis]|uniref:ABC transporter permease n=1 Tax=Paenibacillus nasutitermitis TaxID=1652958 RepID=A0A917DZY2_9BACL|nr:carbohydrate ABC transporter permease [Paenibacillus nasutitermitis]GGD88945.1 ABC transporter permease [Paenibacillus nasutitermitis]
MKHLGSDRFWFHVLGYSIIGFCSLLCIIPVLFIVAGSFTNEEEVIRTGYSLLPREWSVAAYRLVFEVPGELLHAGLISVSLTVIGTTVGLFLTAMTAYALQRKTLKYRNVISFYIYFTSVFSGGLVPYYIVMVSYLHMKNNYLALLIPLLLNVFNILVMKGFFASLPEEIVESGKIDGAGEFTVFRRLMIPIAKPGLATIGLFIALAYWNDFFSSILFITNQNLITLQYYLYNLLNKADSIQQMTQMSGIAVADFPKETVKLAVTSLVIAPILIVFPIAQRFIVNGVTLGAVKG